MELEKIIKLLEDNHQIILTDYKSFNFDDNHGIEIEDDYFFDSWKKEYDLALDRVNNKEKNTIPIQKHKFWYAYQYEKKFSWETILIGNKSNKNNFIIPSQYGKKFFKNTLKLLKGIDKIEKIAVARLLSKSQIPLHRGDDRYYRIHLGLIIPDGDIAFQVNDNLLKWEEGKCFYFNDSDPHMAWNNTKYDRIILIVDVLK